MDFTLINHARTNVTSPLKSYNDCIILNTVQFKCVVLKTEIDVIIALKHTHVDVYKNKFSKLFCGYVVICMVVPGGCENLR